MLPTPYAEIDGITLYHGDCREILPNLATAAVDFVLTDPPYGVSYSGRWGGDQPVIEGDYDLNWVPEVYSELWRIQKPDTLCLSFFGWPSADKFVGPWKCIGYRPVSLIALIKDRWGFGQFTRAQYEPAYLLAKGHPARPSVAISDVLDCVQQSHHLHPNQKPLGAMLKLLIAYVSASSVVIDPFAGSGTTLIAARALGLSAIGIEIEERYCELAAIRLSQQIFEFKDFPAPPEQLALI